MFLGVAVIDPLNACWSCGLVGRVKFDLQHGATRQAERRHDPAVDVGVDRRGHHTGDIG